MREANLAGSILRADLRGADLRGADLQGTDLRESYLAGARLEGSRTDEHTRWPGDAGTQESDPDPIPSARDRDERLSCLDGATLTWRWMAVSLGFFRLTARLGKDRFWQVGSGGTTLVDLPHTCTNALIRTATPEQRDAYCAGLSAEPFRLPTEQVFVVRCDEGEFTFSDTSLRGPGVEPCKRSYRNDLSSICYPLWPLGPGLTEWWTRERG